VVQALKALGKDRVGSSVVATIRQQLGPTACARILRDTRAVTGWIYEIIKQVCREGE